MARHRVEYLTPVQERILRVIRESITDHGEAPLVTEIGEAVGLSSRASVLAWLRRRPAARLLGQLVTAPDELDHAALDALPQGHATTYVRSLLTTAGLLPPRDENLALLINWTARTLAKLPGHQATLIRPFAEWHIIRDARRRSARGRYTYTAHKGNCANIRAAIDFLTWLDTQQHTLQSLTQENLDIWAISRPTLRACSIPFIRWAGARHLTRAGLTIEHPPPSSPASSRSKKTTTRNYAGA
ncbi:hypothetical protein [Streptomyces sp. NPDC053367]|uniref:LexA family protein n=1 Tax=Streptomyces sp. NPDC053367 TaxID=3365700 RepID=UPI0037D65DF2